VIQGLDQKLELVLKK
jgi:hypothetical protein